MARTEKKQVNGDKDPLSRADCLIDIRKSLSADLELERFKMVLSEMHEGIILTDPKNRIQWLNKKACDYLDIVPEEALGKPMKSYSNESYVNDSRKFFDTMSSSELDYLEFEHEIGSRIINFRMSPLQQKGQFIGILRVLRDVTANRKAQEQVRLLAQAVAGAAEAIYITDTQMRVIYINPAFTQITGFEKNECIGKKIDVLKAGKEDEEMRRGIWNSVKRGKSWSGRLVSLKKNGLKYTADCTISPVFGENGEVEYLVHVEKDITRELEIESQLLHSQKMEFVGRLTGGIAHDFNNMLTAIIGNSHLLLAEMDQRDPLRKTAEEVLKASLSAASFIRQLLSFSRRQRGEVQVVNLNYVVGEMEPLLKRLIGENIKVKIRNDPRLSNNLADQGQIEQIISNLALNARDAMPEGGRLVIRTRNLVLNDEMARSYNLPNGEYTVLSFTDNGVGIEKQYLGKVLEPFFTTKEKGKGTGLGLSIVYGIVKRYGGEIRVKSSKGKGTKVKILLPVAEEEIEERKREHGAGRDDSPTGSEIILLIEDEEVVANFASTVMQRLGYQVFVCKNGKEALKIYTMEADHVDLIVCDHILPDTNGVKLVEQLLKMKKNSNTKVLFISGYPRSYKDSRNAIVAQAPLLEKPFTPAVLAGKIREVLDGKS